MAIEQILDSHKAECKVWQEENNPEIEIDLGFKKIYVKYWQYWDYRGNTCIADGSDGDAPIYSIRFDKGGTERTTLKEIAKEWYEALASQKGKVEEFFGFGSFDEIMPEIRKAIIYEYKAKNGLKRSQRRSDRNLNDEDIVVKEELIKEL